MLFDLLWLTTQYSNIIKHNSSDVNFSACAFRYFCAIAIHWIIDTLQCHFLFHVHTYCGLLYDFSQHLCSNEQRENLGFLYQAMCVKPFPCLMFFLKLPSHISAMPTFCHCSCLSPIGWQVRGKGCCLIYWTLHVLVVHIWLRSSMKGI